MSKKLIDLTGKKFGRLTVIERAPNTKFKHTTWLCKCDCGVIRTVNAQALRQGRTRSCGCFHKDEITKRQTTHGLSESPEYYAWANMKSRCTKPDHPQSKDYILRGIKVCARWMENFDNFLADMGRKPTPKHSLDRIDVDGNYSPENCKWASKQDQYRNRRVRFIEDFSDKQIKAEYARRFPAPATRYNFVQSWKPGMFCPVPT